MNKNYVGIFILSAAMLILQVALTRVLSVSLWYHFGFLVISTALLGFGASGSLLSVWTWLRKEADLDRAITAISLLFSVMTVGCFFLMQHVPFEPFGILGNPMQLVWTPLYILLIATPFFFAGLAISLLLTRAGDDVNRVYAWDLAGAGMGCIAVVFIIPILGGSGSIFGASALAAFSGIFFAGKTRLLWVAASGVVGIGFVVASPTADNWMPVTLTANKTSRDAPVEWSKWDAFSRVDLLGREADESTGRPAFKSFRIDGGTAWTGIAHPVPYLKKFDSGEPLGNLPSIRDMAVPLHGKTDPHVLIIGSGGGAEIAESLFLGASQITALEINPIIAETVSTDPFWGDLVQRPNVNLYPVEGRSFLRRSRETYDAIVSVHTISNAAMAAGAMDLAENYVLTLEAFEDYLDHLSDDGTIYFTRPEAHLPRLFSTARIALEGIGVTDVTKHLFAWRGPPSEKGGKSFGSGIVIRKSPFTPGDIDAMSKFLAGPEGAEVTNQLLYSPYPVSENQALAYAEETELEIYPQLLQASDLESVWSSSPAQLAPATDDKPFFNHRTRWSSLSLATIADIFAQEKRGRMALEDRPVAEVTLIVMLIESALIAALLIIAPLLKLRNSIHSIRSAAPWFLYFSALGIGFILVEIVLIQWFTLFLGRPTLTFAAVLATLLIATGVGAAASKKLLGNTPRKKLVQLIGMLIALLIVLSFFLSPIMDITLQLPLAGRLIVTVMVISPVGFFLGMPFPTGLRFLQASNAALVPWAWGVNGFFTVIGSIIAVMLGMTVGFTAVLWCAAACYALILLLVAKRVIAPQPTA